MWRDFGECAAGDGVGPTFKRADANVARMLQTTQKREGRPEGRPANALILLVLFGGAREDRTPDLLNAIQALSHLSYDPAGERHRAMGGAMAGV